MDELIREITELRIVIDIKNDTIRTLKKQNKILEASKNRYYQQMLDDEIKINELYQTLKEIKGIVSGTYEALDSQALQEIRQKVIELEEE